MSIEEIKEEMCDNYCKYLDKANRVHLTRLDDIDSLADMMHDICSKCPLNELGGKDAK